MSNLPGNPHFAWAADTLESLEQAEGTYLNPDEHALQTASVEATLALAHEQRTANLIAYQANAEASYRIEARNPRSEQATKLNETIKERLGL